MGAYELQCTGDINLDGAVDVGDIVLLLANWGQCPDPCPPSCTGDLDESCIVDVGDIIALLGNWSCGATDPAPIAEQLQPYGLTEIDWDDFVDIMNNGTSVQQDNYVCWLNHYLTVCPSFSCPSPGCPDDDPFGNHPPGF